MIVLPVMSAEQTASWLGVLDLYARLPEGWTLIGGQLVHLYCAERGQFPERATNDIAGSAGRRASTFSFLKAQESVPARDRV